MTDLDEVLIAGKGKKSTKQYIRRFEECALKIKTLSHKNNELQKTNYNDMDSDIRKAIKHQASFLEKEIVQIKNLLNQLNRDFTDTASKNKIKELWVSAGKEIERNKRLMAQFVDRASSYSSILKRESEYSERDQVNNNGQQRSKYPTNAHKKNKKQYSQLIQGEMIDDGQLQLQERIMAEKKALLKELQQKNYKINQIYNQMGSMLAGQQRDMVNQIQTNTAQTKQNLINANGELNEAIKQQKSSKKKYVCIATTIIIILLTAVGLIYVIVA